METNKLYDFFNFSDNEIKVFEFYLQNGEMMASQVASKLKMDKSSVYNAVEDLVEKKVLFKNTRKRGTTYYPVGLDIFQHLLAEKQQKLKMVGTKLDEFVASLKAKAKQKVHDSYITVSYGEEAHIMSLNRILSCKEKLVRLKTNIAAPVYNNPEYVRFVRKIFQPKRVQKKIMYRQMFQYQKEYALSEMNTTSEQNFKEARIAPPDFKTNDSYKIYDDYVDITIYEPEKEIMCISIKDASIAFLMKELFDYVWNRRGNFYADRALQSIKLKDGTEMPKIGIGTRGISSWDSPGKIYINENPYTNNNYTVDALSNSLIYKMNYIDTCLKYAHGKSVEVIGELIRNYPRSALQLSGKLTRMDDSTESALTDIKDVEKQCDLYLQKLGVDYLDYFQIHSPNVIAFPIEEAVIAIEKLIQKGKVRRLSVSNFEVAHLTKALVVAQTGIALNEVPYNLIDRTYEKNGVVEFCKKQNIVILSARALGLGRLCGLEYDLDSPQLIRDLCRKYGKTSAQIALNWLLHQDNVAALIKSENPANIRENLNALDFEMSLADYQMLDEFDDPMLRNITIRR